VFVPLFPNLFDVPLFPTIFFALFPCSHCQISNVPLFPQNPWGSLMIGAQDVSSCKRKHAQTRVSWQNFSFLLPRHCELQSSSSKLFLPNLRRRVSFYTLVGQPLSKQLLAFGTGPKSSDFCFPACHFPFQWSYRYIKNYFKFKLIRERSKTRPLTARSKSRK